MKFTIDNEEITVQGYNSILILEYRNVIWWKIILNNMSGSFSINGANSYEKSENISITEII